MDTKVVNRGVNGEYNPWPGIPRFERIFVRDLSELTYNSAVGLGMADVVTDRLVNRIDWAPTMYQFADRQHARRHPHADAFPDRPRVHRAHRAHGGQARSGGSDLRLDPQHHGAGTPGAERESARGGGGAIRCWRSKPPSISISTATTTSSAPSNRWRKPPERTDSPANSLPKNIEALRRSVRFHSSPFCKISLTFRSQRR